MNISDEQLRQYVDNVFDKYDRDKNYTLDEQELLKFFKDLFASMNFNHNVSMEDVKYSLKQIDANNDGKVTKKELYAALKVILGSGKAKPIKKEPNLPYNQQRQKQQFNQKPQIKQPVKQQQYQYKQPQKKPQTPQNYQNYPQNPPQQQQKRPVQKQPMEMIAMGTMGMMGPTPMNMGAQMGGMGMPPGPMFGGLGPPGGMGGMNPFGFW